MPTAKKTQTERSSTVRRQRDRRAASVPTESDIAKRAYEIFIERGGGHGRDLDDWLVATRELQSQNGRKE